MVSLLRHSFSKLKFDVDELNSGLVRVHKDSYNKFLYSLDPHEPSIRSLMLSIFPINDLDGYASIEFVDYRVSSPAFSIEECKVKSLTYGADVFITLRLVLFSVDDSTGIRSIRAIKEQEVFLCNVPLMTDNASFIINGIERIVICQIHKSPGVFFNRKIKENKSIVYTGTIIPYRGSRLEFYCDSKASMTFRIDKKKKLPIYHLLSCLEMTNDSIIAEFYKSIELSFSSDKLLSFSYNLETLVGSAPSFNFRNKDGEVVLPKDTTVTKLTLKKLKHEGNFYCFIEDIIGKVSYRSFKINNIDISVASIITKDLLTKLSKAEIKSFGIVDDNLKTFNASIVNAVTTNATVSYEEAMSTLMKVMHPGETFVLENAKRYFESIFFSNTYYSLMSVGRYKLNKTLGLDTPETHLHLEKSDIIATIKKLVELKQLNAVTDDIDHLGNRRIRSVGELTENQLRIGLQKVVRYAEEKLRSLILDTSMPSDFVLSAPVQKSIRDAFLSDLSQFMEQTNLLSELAHGRKISALGSGGITRDRASSEVRDIHATHYGRICPIETPDGQNIGLITSLASYATINKYGFIETPYRRVVNGKITDDVIYLDAISEYDHYIGQISRDSIDGDQITGDLVSARHKGDFVMARKEDINFVDIAPRQIISVVASLIPFLESNDTGRALMGCNMQRQAVPLLFPESPFVGTGMEKVVVRESGVAVVAKRDGVVSVVDSEHIIVLPNDVDDHSDIDVYKLERFARSNQSTCVNQRPLVKVGENVIAGQVISDGPATANGETALGKNILVAFMPWNGYNFEDSVIISNKLLVDDTFTSLHIEEFEVVVRDTRLGAEEITRDIPGVSDDDLQYLDETGVVHVGVNVASGSILVGKVTPKSETPITSEEKLLRAIFGEKVSEVQDTSLRVPPGVHGTVVDVKILTRRGNIKDATAASDERKQIAKRLRHKQHEIDVVSSLFNNKVLPLISNSCSASEIEAMTMHQKFNVALKNKESSRALGVLKDQYYAIINKIEAEYSNDVAKIMDGDDLPNGVLKVVKIFVATKSRLQSGDKIAGRHGNKGVVSLSVPVEDMPYMADGTPIDLIFSSVSVPGRMNIGQVLETHLGLVSYGVGKKIDSLLLEKSAASKVRSFILDIASDESFKDSISKMSDDELIALAQKYKRGIYFDTPVFDGAKVDDISALYKKLDISESGQVTLYDGRTGEPFDRPVTVGYMYVMKLHHLVDGKMHARSIGPYSLVTQQPLGGKSHFGGQRLGEMECWALQAYGAAYTLQEMLTVKSDDVVGRKKMYESIINGETRFHSAIPESFNVLCKELRSLCFDLEFGLN